MALEEADPVAKALASLGLEPALADPGLSGQGYDRTPPLEKGGEGGLELRELRLAADERAQRRGGPGGALAGDAEHGDGSARSFQLDLAQRLELELVLHLAGGFGPDDELTECLKARGHV